MKQFIYSLFGMKTTIVLLILFAIASATATIVESAYSTDAAWAFIYGSLWFGAIQVLLGVCLVVGIFKYEFYNSKNIPSFIFHVSFLFILIGSIITRYFGYEGTLHIREGSQNNLVSSREVYIQFASKDGDKLVRDDHNGYLSSDSKKNSFDIKLKVDGKKAILSYKDFVINGAFGWVASEVGHPVAVLLFYDDKNKRSVTMIDKQNINIGDLSLAFNEDPKQEKYIKIFLDGGKFYIKTNEKVAYTDTATLQKSDLQKDVAMPFNEHYIYEIEGINFSATTLLKSAKKGIVKLPEKSMGNNVLIADLSYNDDKKEVFIFFGDLPKVYNVGGKDFMLAWAPKERRLPFALHLNKFNLDRYPGSNSPSGYSSDVVVKDEHKNREFEYKIYMNHVLDYAGYRFFQSSYDMDEKGTILTVNRDPGKFPTYIGYTLLCGGMLLNFFNKNSRFVQLSRMVDESSARDKKSRKNNEKNS